MRNMGNAAEYFMFFKWKSKILRETTFEHQRVPAARFC